MTETTITPEFLRPRLLTRKDESHKGDYGHLLLVCGCETMPGAAVLATGAALRSGCGLVTLHSTGRALQAVVNAFPSALLSEDPGRQWSRVPASLEHYSAIAVGPGLGRAPETLTAFAGLLRSAFQARIPMVLDADALNLLGAHPELLASVPAGSVLTPHLGELRRLLSWETEAQKERAVQALCRQTGCVLVHKGYRSRLFTPSGERYTNTTGNAGMAKGGSGDVLTGLVGGLMARGYPALDAAALGVWIHGHAGDCLTRSCTAEAYDSRDLVDQLKKGFLELVAPS